MITTRRPPSCTRRSRRPPCRRRTRSRPRCAARGGREDGESSPRRRARWRLRRWLRRPLRRPLPVPKRMARQNASWHELGMWRHAGEAEVSHLASGVWPPVSTLRLSRGTVSAWGSMPQALSLRAQLERDTVGAATYPCAAPTGFHTSLRSDIPRRCFPFAVLASLACFTPKTLGFSSHDPRARLNTVYL